MVFDDDTMDDVFKNKLKNFETEDSNFDSWEQIASSLDVKSPKTRKNNRRIYVKLVVLSTVLISIVLVLSTRYVVSDSKSKDILSKNQAPVIKKNEHSTFVAANSSKKSVGTMNTQEIIADKEYKALKENTSFVIDPNIELNLRKKSRLILKKDGILKLYGDATFKIKNNTPITVVTLRGSIKGSNASFSVYLDKGNMEHINVKSGSVDVIYAKSNDKKTHIRANESVTIREDNNIEKNKIETNHESWNNGRLVFKNESMKNVIKDLEEFYDIKIDVANERLYNCQFTGVFEKSTFEETIEVLSQSVGFDREIREGKYLIFGESCE